MPLYAKALDNRSSRSILHDEKADEIVSMIDYDFEKLKGFGNGNVMVVRAKQLDEWVKEFLGSHLNAVVLNLGCGLDARVYRINPPSTVSWFDVDFPEVIEERRNFYSNTGGYQMIASSITKPEWLQKIPKDRSAFMIADGVLEYLTEEQVKELLNRITSYFPRGQIAFDIMNSYAVRMGKGRLKERTGAEHKWAVDDVNEVDRLDPKLRRVANLPLLGSKYLPLKNRLLFGVALILPRYKNMMRLLRYEF
jgi:O-methyltransferase involved in polyketide biosynthesis